MSVGPGVIRAFRGGVEQRSARAPKSENSDRGRTQRRSPKPTGQRKGGRVRTREVVQQAEPAAALPKAAPQETLQKRRGGAALRPDHVKVCLKPTASQLVRLAEIFAAPRVLAALLSHYSGKITSVADASVFLLRNRKALDGYINPRARIDTVDVLTRLLLHWAAAPPQSIGIDFDSGEISRKQAICFPVEGLRAVAVVHPKILAEVREGFKARGPFTLFEDAGAYYAAFVLAPQSYIGKSDRSTPSERKPPTRPIPEIKLRPGDPLPHIVRDDDSTRERVLYSRSSVFPGGLRNMNWDALSGWAVSGGLPSLGRRR